MLEDIVTYSFFLSFQKYLFGISGTAFISSLVNRAHECSFILYYCISPSITQNHIPKVWFTLHAPGSAITSQVDLVATPVGQMMSHFCERMIITL